MGVLKRLAACAALLLVLYAAPAQAVSYCGDIYLGFSLGSQLTGMMGAGMGGFSSMAQQMSIPFKGKVAYCDGGFRIDLDVPALADLAAGGQAGRFQVLTILVDNGQTRFTLLNHEQRRAYRLTVPPEYQELLGPRDPMEALTSKEFVQAFAEGGVRVRSTKRLKGRSFGGLKTTGMQLTFSVDLPKEQLKEMQAAGFDFDNTFTLRFYLEEESKFPLFYEMGSALVNFSFEVINISLDPLPDVMFRVPDYYVTEDFSVADLERFVNRLASDLMGYAGSIELPPEIKQEIENAAEEEPLGGEEETPEPRTGGRISGIPG